MLLSQSRDEISLSVFAKKISFDRKKKIKVLSVSGRFVVNVIKKMNFDLRIAD